MSTGGADPTANQSPSNCTYCYQLECSVRIEPTLTGHNKATVTAKNAMVTVGRNSQRRIMLQIELRNAARSGQPAVMTYSLANAVVHQQNVVKGKSSIEIPTRNIIIQFSNCPPRKLNVFVKSLQAKLEIMKSESSGKAIAENRLNVPNGSNGFNVLSPLSIGEIRKIRKMRGISTGESPLARNSSPPKRGNEKKSSSSTTPISSARDRRILASSIGLKRMRTFAGFNDELHDALAGFVPLKAISEEVETGGVRNVNRIELSDEQKRVVRCVVEKKENVFFTGSAGTGKSVILQRIIEMLPASSTFITAATGVAACQIGGVTLHSFAGIGVGGGSEEQCVQKVAKEKHLIRQWKQCDHLIIDEISMIDKDYFAKLEYVARKIRNKDCPFGGIQLIITGDFLQLPPVSKEDPKFCFESDAWNRCITKTIVLEKVKRQDDNRFVEILEKIRFGRCDPVSSGILSLTSDNQFKNGIVPTRLCTHTADASKINEHNLQKIEEKERIFHSHDDGYVPESVQSMISKVVVLKVGCQVMLIKNIDLSRGLSNGSRGFVRAFSENGNPMVHFVSTNRTIEIRRSKFSVRIPGSEVSITRTQIPLQLAWAISIHKSQGLTLDCIEMSLKNVFADGQAYVALSRARSLSAIRVIGFEAGCVRANNKVLEFYKTLDFGKDQEEEDFSNGFVIGRKRIRMSI